MTQSVKYDFIQLNQQIPINNYDEKQNRGGWYNWGEDNLFPNYLLELYNKSAKHSSLVQTKAQMIGGNGVDTSSLPDQVKLFLRNRYNSKKETIDEIISKISYDLEIYNGFALQIIWSRDRQTIASVGYADPFNLRIAVEQDGDVCENYYYCKDWTSTRKYKPEFVQGFTTEIMNDKTISPNQILFVKSYVPTQLHYPQPKYLSGSNWIEIDYEISVWHLSGLKNEFSPRTIIALNSGIPTKDEIDNERKRLKDEFEGPEKSGKTMFLYAPDKEHAPDIHKLDGTTSDQRYLLLNKDAQEGIFVAHQVVSPALHGIRVEGQLGNTKELVDSLKVFQSQYIDARQKIIEDTFNKLAAINGLSTKLELNKYELELDVEISTGDLLSILQSSLTPEQKYNLLVQLGYNEDAAMKLTGYNKNNLQ